MIKRVRRFNKEVVVINGDMAQLELIRGLLVRQSFLVKAYDSGETAMQRLVREGPPDLIITNLYLPDIDGLRLCHLLRSPKFRDFNGVPMLVMSAVSNSDETFRITQEAGADAFLAMPFKVQAFIETVFGLFRHEPLEYLPGVLIVEDSKTLAGLLAQAFDGHGYHAETAFDGKEACEKFDRILYDVVILDYHLPDMLGEELLVRFRAKRPQTVVIVMTADPRPELALQCMNNGAFAYLRKPFDTKHLLELCEKARRPNTEVE